MMDRILKLILWIQGLYYGLTGLWAIVALDHFAAVTGHVGDPFEMHSIAALALVLAAAFLTGALYPKYRIFAGWLLFGSAIAVIIPEIVYFPEIQGTLFVYDLAEEIVMAIIALFVLKSKRQLLVITHHHHNV